MSDHLKSDCIIEEKIWIGQIPAILFRPKLEKKTYPTLIFYHGWSSRKENQRIRGLILSSVGYQVVIPDAIYHGERNPLSNYNKENTLKYFGKVVLTNIEESNLLVDQLVSKHKADPDRIGVLGHSMGGFTSAGIFTHNPKLKALVVFNGSCAWEKSNETFIETFKISLEQLNNENFKGLRKKISDIDPMNNLNLLKDRPILMLHGDRDEAVPVQSQRAFYKAIEPIYRDKDKIKYIEYPNLNHFLTTNMMEEAIAWFYKYL